MLSDSDMKLIAREGRASREHDVVAYLLAISL
jgi:hypothetical protein